MGMSSMFAGSASVAPATSSSAVNLRPADVNWLNCATRISAARESASSGETVPSVSISRVSLS